MIYVEWFLSGEGSQVGGVDTVPVGIQAARAQMESPSCLLSLSLLSSHLSGNCIHCLLPPVRAEDSRSGAQILGWGCLEMAASASWCFPVITGGPEHRVPGFPHIQEETCPSKAPCLLVSSPASHGKLTHVKQFPSGSHFAVTEQGGFQVMI